MYMKILRHRENIQKEELQLRVNEEEVIFEVLEPSSILYW
jgi:hypothetical protein